MALTRRRLTTHSRGNKNQKLDLEASVYIPPRFSPLLDEGFLLALESGSSKSGIRDVIILGCDSLLLVEHDVTPNFQAVNATFWEHYCEPGTDFVATHQEPSPLVVFYAPELYQLLRDHTAFSVFLSKNLKNKLFILFDCVVNTRVALRTKSTRVPRL